MNFSHLFSAKVKTKLTLLIGANPLALGLARFGSLAERRSTEELWNLSIGKFASVTDITILQIHLPVFVQSCISACNRQFHFIKSLAKQKAKSF